MARSTNIKPVPVDANGWKINDRGRDWFVTTESLTTAHLDVVFPRDFKEFAIQVNSGTMYFRGTQPGTRIFLAASAIVDNLDGTVTITTGRNHGFTVGDPVELGGLTNYSGSYDLETGTATNQLVITATYVAETPSTTAYADGYRDGSTTAGTGPIPIVGEAGDTAATIWSDSTATVTIYAWR